MDWCAREWNAGLGLLVKAYGFRVEPYANRPPGYSDRDLFRGPNQHAVSFQGRVLWLESEGRHCEWLHEVAHLVCAPPWEKDPNESAEFGGIFAWERAVGMEFRRLGLWSDEDVKHLDEVQDIYGLGMDGEGEAPEAWKSERAPYGPSEWHGIPAADRRRLMMFFNRTLRMTGLLNGRNRPTWKAPVWNEEIRRRWELTFNFAKLWGEVDARKTAQI